MRPSNTVAIITPGHHRPQNTNWAKSRKLSQRCALWGGGGRNSGTTMSKA